MRSSGSPADSVGAAPDTGGVKLTLLLVVGDLERSRSFYRDALGATVVREYGGTSCVLNFQGSWILLVTGGCTRSLSLNLVLPGVLGDHGDPRFTRR